jgi:methyl-accepting chemotaxis protein
MEHTDHAPGQQDRAGLSVFWKIAALIAASSAVLCLVLAFAGSVIARSLAMDSLQELAENATVDMANSAARPIRFKDAAEIERLASDLVALAGERVKGIAVLNAAGEPLFLNVKTGTKEDTLVSFGTATTENRVEMLDYRRFMKGVPVLVGQDGNQVGVVSVLWTAEPVLNSVAARTQLMYAGTAVLFVALVLGSAFVARRMITQPLDKIGDALNTISTGQYGIAVEGTSRKDELGTFARHLEHLRSKLNAAQSLQEKREEEQAEQQRVVRQLRDGLSALSGRDLTCSIDEAFPAEYEPLRKDFNQGLQRLNQIISAVKSTTAEVRCGAEEISASSDQIAHRIETQAATLEQTSATLTQLTESVSEAASNAKEVEGIVLATQERSNENDVVVKNAVEAMSEIEQSSGKISDIISVIDDIAFQTNLLALNAGVEAARAGEAGRGFAVVATEVRSLAQRSAEAAKEIKELITGSADQVNRGVELVRAAGDALTEISGQVSHISGLVSGIAESATQQASGISEINSGVSQMEAATQENAAMVEESNAAGHNLKTQSVELDDLTSQFTVDTGKQRGTAHTSGAGWHNAA